MAKRFERLYIEYSYIYSVAKDNGRVQLQLYICIYIYNVAKLIGKASENHTDNYRQLQLWIKWIKVWIKCG